MAKTINTNPKYAIYCDKDYYRVANIKGKVPKNHDCIIEGWHLKNGKVVAKGNIHFVPGDGHFIIRGNVVETRKTSGVVFEKNKVMM
jgi:hypothetical protein